MCWTAVVGWASFLAGRSCSLSGESSPVGGAGRGGLGGMYGSGMGCGVAGLRWVIVCAPVAASSRRYTSSAGPQWGATHVGRRNLNGGGEGNHGAPLCDREHLPTYLNGGGDVLEWSSCGRPGWHSQWQVRSCRRRGAMNPCAEWSWPARRCRRLALSCPMSSGVSSLVVLSVLPVPQSRTSASPVTFAPRMLRLVMAGCCVPLGCEHGPRTCIVSIVGVPV